MADTPPPVPEPAAPPPPERPRRSPLVKRLPLLALVALGLWLWQVTGTPERELVFQFSGDEWAQVRALDFQLVAEDGKVLKREERFFASAPPPPELTFKADLPEGPWQARFFFKVQGREERLRLEDRLVVGEDRYIVRQLRLPPARR